MRERVKRYFEDFEKALTNLESAAEQSRDDLDIDGTIKRFELCYELSWKLIKEYLADMGIICKNPRDCFKSAFLNDLIDSEDTWLKMIDDRNYLVHTYTFEESRKIFERIKGSYVTSLKYLYTAIRQKSEGE
ncbi:MAG: nucleotidyltransferase substrate binding protein [Candidatus Brocadiaceae bacterium]|nr:nucleotidyltransferase substrate binding protein [Candidatus Brocadiaceae bacterium]